MAMLTVLQLLPDILRSNMGLGPREATPVPSVALITAASPEAIRCADNRALVAGFTAAGAFMVAEVEAFTVEEVGDDPFHHQNYSS